MSARPPMAEVEAIVIGASAGGVEALSELLPALPAAMRAAAFVVLHLPRHRPSLLVPLLQARCAVAVREAEDAMPVEPGTVYVAPPDYHLLVDDGPRVRLSVDAAVHHSRPSIDVLFESAAELYGPRALGIVLTGANEDGATGLAAIHRAGGWTIVQDPATALVPAMTEAALRATAADHVLPLAGIAGILRALATREEEETR
jgi:two-component system chemotaxis response regulator CheB